MNRLTMSAMSALFAPNGGDGNGLVRAGEVADNGNVGGVEQLFQNGCCGDRRANCGSLLQIGPWSMSSRLLSADLMRNFSSQFKNISIAALV